MESLDLGVRDLSLSLWIKTAAQSRAQSMFTPYRIPVRPRWWRNPSVHHTRTSDSADSPDQSDMRTHLHRILIFIGKHKNMEAAI